MRLKNKRDSLTQEQLKEYLSYNPDTGVFVRVKASPRGRDRTGEVAGHIEVTGYSAINVLSIKYLAHRLAWLYMTGAWPNDLIDHINGNRADNRFANLREADANINQQNLSSARSHNKIGLLGVSSSKKRWKAEIRANGHRTHLGTYDTPDEAHQAYLSAKKKVHVYGRIV